MSAASPKPVVVAEILRSGVVEGHHYGSVVALAPDGSVDWSLGDVGSPILPRSCNKPFQALGMVELGLELPPDLLALVCSSHSAEPFHLDGVRRILARAGLDESALLCPPSWPLQDANKEHWIRQGGERESIVMDCSGKHAGMLTTCVINGWETESYTSPDHPLQVALRESFARFVGVPVERLATDGCGAPIFPASLTALAGAFRALALADAGPARQIAEAMRAFPDNVSGTTRDESALMRALPGAICKAGAEACYVVALPDGRAFALKIDDGAARARPVVMAGALERSGVSWKHASRGAGALRSVVA